MRETGLLIFVGFVEERVIYVQGIIISRGICWVKRDIY